MVSVGKRISILRNAAALKQAELAQKLGVAQSKVSKWESDTHPPKADDLQKLASYFKVEPKDILGLSPVDPAMGRKVEVMGELQAGAFSEAIAWNHDDRYFLTVPLDPEMDAFPLQGYKVRGDSMNRIYPDGSIVYVTPIHAYGQLETGDIVMVMRRDKHGLEEGTLKEYVEEDGHKWLWPRSTSPLHQTPIDYHNSRNGDIEEVRIVGVVMAALVRSKRRVPPTA